MSITVQLILIIRTSSHSCLRQLAAALFTQFLREILHYHVVANGEYGKFPAFISSEV